MYHAQETYQMVCDMHNSEYHLFWSLDQWMCTVSPSQFSCSGFQVRKKSQSVPLSTVSCDFLWAWVVWVGPGEEQGFGLQQSLGRNVDVLVLKK